MSSVLSLSARISNREVKLPDGGFTMCLVSSSSLFPFMSSFSLTYILSFRASNLSVAKALKKGKEDEMWLYVRISDLIALISPL